jgi:hypothetical protein
MPAEGPFTLAIRAFAEKANERANDVVRTIVEDVGSRLAERSPVGNPDLWEHPAYKGYVGGTFRHNWQLGVDERPVGVFMREAGSFPAESTVSAQVTKIPAVALGHVFYWVNNLPYAWALEHGHSTQSPPQGIVGLTTVEFSQIVSGAVQTTKAGGA